MSRFRSKVVEIEAIEWNGHGLSISVPEWIIAALHADPGSPGFIIPELYALGLAHKA